eukprot:gene9641-32223_t
MQQFLWLWAGAATTVVIPTSVHVAGPYWSCGPNHTTPCDTTGGGSLQYDITAPGYQYFKETATSNVTALDVLLPDNVLAAVKAGLNATAAPTSFRSQLQYHNLQNAVVATPRFSTTPWFCDGDQSDRLPYPVRHESYLQEVVVPLLRELYCPQCKHVDLIGFNLYRKAAAWDAPTMLSAEYCTWLSAQDNNTADMWQMMQQFGTCDAWKRYSPFELMPKASPTFKDPARPRLSLSGQHYFGNMASATGAPGSPFNHTVQMHARMLEYGIVHEYNDSLDPGKHEWSPLWLKLGLNFLSSENRVSV